MNANNRWTAIIQIQLCVAVLRAIHVMLIMAVHWLVRAATANMCSRVSIQANRAADQIKWCPLPKWMCHSWMVFIAAAPKNHCQSIQHVAIVHYKRPLLLHQLLPASAAIWCKPRTHTQHHSHKPIPFTTSLYRQIHREMLIYHQIK